MTDETGWPLIEGARVRVTYWNLVHQNHKPGCRRTGGCPCPSSPKVRHGLVERLVPQPASGRAFVEVREFETQNILTPAPDSCRVMRGKTNAQRRAELLTVEGRRAYRRRKK